MPLPIYFGCRQYRLFYRELEVSFDFKWLRHLSAQDAPPTSVAATARRVVGRRSKHYIPIILCASLSPER